ncbi:hypothetical protein NKH18_07060 [Streptomyces sp. M10(2022)]
MSSDELDFHLDDLEPVDAASQHAEEQFWAGDFTVLAEHHIARDVSRSFVVAHDASVTWVCPANLRSARSRSHGT